jgi:aminopeptidase N
MTEEPLEPEAIRQAVTTVGCPRAAAIAVLDHRAELTLSLSPPRLSGHGELRIRTLAPAGAIQLDSAGLSILSASTYGQPLHYVQESDTVCFELPQPAAAGEELALALSWQVDPSTTGLHFSTDQAWAGYRTPAWLPTRLDLAQRATLKLTLTVPDGLELVASHSHDMSGERYGDGLFHVTFTANTPSSPFLYAFAVGRFRRANYYVQGFAFSAVGPPGADLEGVLLELTWPMYQFLLTRTGVKPAIAHYAQVFVHGEAAQEALGMSLISEDALRELRGGPDDDWRIAHELAHQWFGVLIPCADLADLWLSEGFATFMVAAHKEQRWGRPAYDREVERWRARSKKVHDGGRDMPVSLSAGLAGATSVTEAELKACGVIYCRGALVLDKLRRELGEQAFWEGIRRYVADQTGKPTRTEDLQYALTSVSGRDLTAFFERWVYAAAPDL